MSGTYYIKVTQEAIPIVKQCLDQYMEKDKVDGWNSKATDSSIYLDYAYLDDDAFCFDYRGAGNTSTTIILYRLFNAIRHELNKSGHDFIEFGNYAVGDYPKEEWEESLENGYEYTIAKGSKVEGYEGEFYRQEAQQVEANKEIVEKTWELMQP